jgi:hypothetical protein
VVGVEVASVLRVRLPLGSLLGSWSWILDGDHDGNHAMAVDFLIDS